MHINNKMYRYNILTELQRLHHQVRWEILERGLAPGQRCEEHVLYDLEMEKREREMREAEEEKARRRAEQKAKLEASR